MDNPIAQAVGLFFVYVQFYFLGNRGENII